MTDQERTPDGAAEQAEDTGKAAGSLVARQPEAAGSDAAQVDFQDAAPAVVDRPARIGAVMAMLQDVQARLEALADETDRDRDGDIDTPANLGSSGTGERSEPLPAEAARTNSGAGDFAAQEGGHEIVTPERLTLQFASEADLTKFITKVVATRVEALLAERGAQDVISKSAAAAVVEPLAAIPDIAKLAGGIARGLEALAGRTQATAEELGLTKAALAGSQADTVRLETALAATQADLADVKALAQPVKGAVFAIEKGIGIEPDRIYRDGAVPESAKRGAEAAKVLAGLSDNERREVGAAVLAEMYRARA